jgi:20S proteasome alpha/beta subunit
MTLVIGFAASDGTVVASDGQITSGTVRTTGKKIYRLGEDNNHCLWSAAGELALIQRVEEGIAALPNRGQPLANLRDALCQVVRAAAESLLRLDFRTQLVPPQVLLELHPGEFVFAEYREKKPRLLHVFTNGTAEWVPGRVVALGVGAPFAYALLQKYSELALEVSAASLLAYSVVEQAIPVSSYGLGPPIDVWRIDDNGVGQLSEPEVAMLADAARELREAELELFRRHGSARASE